MTNEFHITDSDTGGNIVHIRRYDDEVRWLVEIIGNPKVVKKFAATGVEVQRNSDDSTLFNADTEQLIQFLALMGGYRCKVAKKKKKQYSPETLVAMRERASNLRKNNDKNAGFAVDFSQNSTNQVELDIDEACGESDSFSMFADTPDDNETIGMMAIGM